MDTRSTLFRSVLIFNVPLRIGAVPVGAPFPDIAVHVVQAPGVRRQFPNRVRLVLAIAFVPAGIPEAAASLIPGRCTPSSSPLGRRIPTRPPSVSRIAFCVNFSR